MSRAPALPDLAGPTQHGLVAGIACWLAHHVCGRHAGEIGRPRQHRPGPFASTQPHVCTLDLSAGTSPIECQVEADESEPCGDRLGWGPRVLSGVRIDSLLVEKVRACALQVVRRQLLIGGVALCRCSEGRLDRVWRHSRLKSAGRAGRRVHGSTMPHSAWHCDVPASRVELRHTAACRVPPIFRELPRGGRSWAGAGVRRGEPCRCPSGAQSVPLAFAAAA